MADETNLETQCHALVAESDQHDRDEFMKGFPSADENVLDALDRSFVYGIALGVLLEAH